MKYVFYLLILYSGLILSCGPIGPDACNRDYSFNIPIVFNDIPDTIQLGDSVQFSINFNLTEVIDNNSNESFDISDYPLSIIMGLSWIDTTTAISAHDDITYVELGGLLEFGNVSNTAFIRPEVTDNELYFELKFIPNKKGMLGFSLADFNSSFDIDTNFEVQPNCNETFQFYFDSNLSTDENFEILIQSPILQYQNLDSATQYFPNASFVFIIE